MVAKKIAGQGTMVDVGGGLPAILNGILDEIAAIPAPKEEVVFDLTDYPISTNQIALPSDVYNPIVEALKTKQVFVKIRFIGSTFKSMIVAFNGYNVTPSYPLTCLASGSVISIMLD